MEKYLIVLDLDETLLHNDKTISKYSQGILAKCQSLISLYSSIDKCSLCVISEA